MALYNRYFEIFWQRYQRNKSVKNSLGLTIWWLCLRHWDSSLISLTYSSVWNTDGLDTAAWLDDGVLDELNLCVLEHLANIHQLHMQKSTRHLVMPGFLNVPFKALCILYWWGKKHHRNVLNLWVEQSAGGGGVTKWWWWWWSTAYFLKLVYK